jgi:hypothetical protein
LEQRRAGAINYVNNILEMTAALSRKIKSSAPPYNPAMHGHYLTLENRRTATRFILDKLQTAEENLEALASGALGEVSPKMRARKRLGWAANNLDAARAALATEDFVGALENVRQAKLKVKKSLEVFRGTSGLGEWPQGRSYWSTANFRAPYDHGYFQDNNLMGLGSVKEELCFDRSQLGRMQWEASGSPTSRTRVTIGRKRVEP